MVSRHWKHCALWMLLSESAETVVRWSERHDPGPSAMAAPVTLLIAVLALVSIVGYVVWAVYLFRALNADD